MAIKRITIKRANKAKETKFKGKAVASLTPREKEELLEIIAKKLGLI